MIIIAAVRNEENVKLIRNAGTDVTVSLSRVRGFLMAAPVNKPGEPPR
jgi:hypothetical protein